MTTLPNLSGLLLNFFCSLIIFSKLFLKTNKTIAELLVDTGNWLAALVAHRGEEISSADALRIFQLCISLCDDSDEVKCLTNFLIRS